MALVSLIVNRSWQCDYAAAGSWAQEAETEDTDLREQPAGEAAP